MTIHDGFTFGISAAGGVICCFAGIIIAGTLLVGIACAISDIYDYFKNRRQERVRRALIEGLADKYRDIALETLSMWQLKILDDLYNYSEQEGVQFIKEWPENEKP